MRERATNKPSRNVEVAVWGGLAVVVFGIMVAFIVSKLRTPPLPVYTAMTDFVLTNQDGQKVTLADLRGQVWIADAIFTRCPGQCLIMSGHMKEIQSALTQGQPIRLVSFTTDPAFDQPPVLKTYAEHVGARPGCWTFLTGDKAALHSAELDGLKLAVMDKPAGQQTSANDLFIHSEKFVLIDKAGRIRAWFDGEKPETVGMVVAAAQALAGE